MAVKRRRKTTRRRTTHARARSHNPINPTRRRRRRASPRRHHVYARRRNPINPTHRRRHTRRRRSRNPFTGGATGEILNFTVAGIAQGIATPFVGGFLGRFLPFGQYNPPIIAFGTGWLLSQVFKMFGFTRRFSHPAFVFGAATAAMQVLQPIVARTLGGGANPMMSGWRNGYAGWQPRPGTALRGIAAVAGIPPTIQPPPLPPQGNNQAGMSGMGMRPGNWQ